MLSNKNTNSMTALERVWAMKIINNNEEKKIDDNFRKLFIIEMVLCCCYDKCLKFDINLSVNFIGCSVKCWVAWIHHNLFFVKVFISRSGHYIFLPFYLHNRMPYRKDILHITQKLRHSFSITFWSLRRQRGL